MSHRPLVDCVFHQATNTCTYIVADSNTGTCVIIDPVLDFFYNSGTTKTETANKVLDLVKQKGYHVSWILETHAHADHITGPFLLSLFTIIKLDCFFFQIFCQSSAAQYLKEKLSAKIAIGKNITKVQQHFAKLLNLNHFPVDGSQWDHLWQVQNLHLICENVAFRFCLFMDIIIYQCTLVIGR